MLAILRNCSFVPPVLSSNENEFISPYVGEDMQTFQQKNKISKNGTTAMNDFVNVIMRHIHIKYNVFHCDLMHRQIMIDDKMQIRIIDFCRGKYEPDLSKWNGNSLPNCGPGLVWEQTFVGM